MALQALDPLSHLLVLVHHADTFQRQVSDLPPNDSLTAQQRQQLRMAQPLILGTLTYQEVTEPMSLLLDCLQLTL
ncbi:hypothetical protein D3C80_2035380 [compost metagenome]